MELWAKPFFILDMANNHIVCTSFSLFRVGICSHHRIVCAPRLLFSMLAHAAATTR